MFADKSVNSIFPTSVFAFQLGDVDDFNAYLEGVVDAVRRDEGWDEKTLAGRKESLEHLQSNDLLHQRPDWARFCEVALAASRDVMKFLRYRYEDIGITSLWFNVSRPGYSHKNHVHPNNILSGVYYLRGDAEAGDIVFDDPRPQANVIMPDVAEATEFNTHAFSVTPKPGQLVMFPSWLAHRVAINRGNRERISISYNVMLRGNFGFPKAYA